jgi:hypothetical protein
MPVSEFLGQIAPGTAVLATVNQSIEHIPVVYFHVASLLRQQARYAFVLFIV